MIQNKKKPTSPKGRSAKSKRPWNRVHFFKRKKSNEKVGHPVYVYGKSKRTYKYLTFTHSPEQGREHEYEQLKHNIDPDKDGQELSYVKKKFEVNRHDAFRDPDRKYRIHEEDIPTIKKYKK